MKNYVNFIAFEQGTNLSTIKKLLEENEIKYEETTCYSASLKQEICETLEANKVDINEDNLEKALDLLEKNDTIWESLEEAVSNVIDENFIVEAK
jgi:hypothetical protein